MRKSGTIFLLFCGIVFGLAAFPVFAQKEEVKEVEINMIPLKNFGLVLKNKIESGEIDADKPFKIVLQGILTPDGRFDRQNTTYLVSEGDEQIIQTAKNAIEAVSDSGWFGYLRNLGVEKVKITLEQSGETFSANIQSEQKDENKARTLVSGLNTLVSIFKNDKSLNADSKILLNGLRITNTGNNFVLNFALPKKELHEIMLRNWTQTNDNNSAGE